jgi:hypothetical protein
MRRIFESEKEIQNLINGMCDTDKYWIEAMATDTERKVLGTLVKQNPETGWYYPVKPKCYQVDDIKVIPTQIAESGEMVGVLISPTKLRIISGDEYQEFPLEGRIEFKIKAIWLDLTDQVKEIIDQFEESLV